MFLHLTHPKRSNLVNIECQLRSLNDEKRYAYVSYNDLKTISEYCNKTVMAIRAPPETKLQVGHIFVPFHLIVFTLFLISSVK